MIKQSMLLLPCLILISSCSKNSDNAAAGPAAVIVQDVKKSDLSTQGITSAMHQASQCPSIEGKYTLYKAQDEVVANGSWVKFSFLVTPTTNKGLRLKETREIDFSSDTSENEFIVDGYEYTKDAMKAVAVCSQQTILVQYKNDDVVLRYRFYLENNNMIREMYRSEKKSGVTEKKSFILKRY